jgi:hypothetical protein
VSDVVISNLTIDCRRHEWFWWGDGEPFHFNIKKRSEVHNSFKKEDDRPAGVIRNVLIRDVVARGRGASVCNGHPESWLDGITMDNVKIFIGHDPEAAYDKAVDALVFRQAKNLKLRDVEIAWEEPAFSRWRSALFLDEIRGLEVRGFTGRQAGTDGGAAVVLNQVEDAVIRQGRAAGGTDVFIEVRGDRSRDIAVRENDLRNAAVPSRTAAGVRPGAVDIRDNLTRSER